MSDQPGLKRALALPQVMLYGIGTILGAGIYVLVGEVAASAGLWAPVSFVIAAALAALSGLSFAELSSRYPVSAGEAVYVQNAFHRPQLSAAVGLLVVLTGGCFVSDLGERVRRIFQRIPPATEHRDRTRRLLVARRCGGLGH